VKKQESIDDPLTRLEQAEATIRAIQAGEVDAVVVNGPHGPQVYTLQGADHPYRVLVEQMHEGTVTLDADRIILYSNRQFAAMLEADVDSIAGTQFDRFLADLDSGIFERLTEATLLRGYSSGELDLAGMDGNPIPVRVSMTRLDVAGMQTICVLASDLREQRRNDAIVKEEQLSRLILDQAGEAITVIDPQGLIVRCSQSACSLAGQAILLNHFDHAFPLTASGSPLNAQWILSAAREFQRIRGLEAVLAHPGGEHCSILLSSSPLRSPSNQLLGCVVTMTDITQRKRVEEALAIQAEELTRANSDLRQFAHSASHDLREPMRQLAVFSELLQRKYRNKLDPEAAEIIQHSVDAAHRMEGLLKGLLEYTQASDTPQSIPAASDANEILRKTLATFEIQIEESGTQVNAELLPMLRVHDVHLTQLFQNLIGNALKYRSAAPPVIRIAAERADEMWTISISDNGIGIAPEYQEQIFGLFQRLHGGAKYSGSGIGLAICQKIVQRYGGRIWVESSPGRGSKFAFALPGGDRDLQRS
jgi:PAS domain S-box-containing protein